MLAENVASPAEIRALTSGTKESLRLTNLRKEADEDQEYQQLKNYIQKGFPSYRSQLPDLCRRYWNVRSQLTIDDGLIVFGCRLLIPSTMRHSTHIQLHDAHQGSIRTKQRARHVI